MSRSKKHSNDELEQLRTENRELKSTVKSLLRQIKKLEKEYKTEFVQEDLIVEDLETKIPKCTKCGKGKIKQVSLGPRTLISCTICEYSKVVKSG
jgi:Tfp pilus assembly protein PilO